MYNRAALAYQTTQQKTASPRELEATLLIRAAARLQSVREGWDEADDDLLGALMFNRKLWTILATSATGADNPLPLAMKNNIANLAIFIFNRTLDIQANPRPELLTSLISINVNIAAGLRGSAG